MRRRRPAIAVRLLQRLTAASLSAAAVVGLLAPGRLQAQNPVPLGSDDGAVLVLQGHASRAADPLIWTGPIFRLPVPALSQADLRIDATRFVPNVGRVRGSVDIAADTGDALGRGLIELADGAVRSWIVGISAGDTPLSAYSIDYRLSSLFTPYAGLRGVQVSATHGAAEVSVFGGRTTTSAGWFGEKVIVSPQALAGGRVVIHAKRLALATSVTSTSATPHPGLDIPLSSTAIATDLLYPIWRGLEAIGQATLTQARWLEVSPAKTDTAASDDRAVSWIAGMRLVSPHRHADFSVVHLGREYIPLPYYTVGDRAGWYASADQQFGQRLQVYGSANQWHNNLAERPRDQTISVDQAFVGGRWQLTESSFIGGRAGAGSVRRGIIGTEVFRSTQRSAYADYTKQLGAWRIMPRGSDVQTVEDDPARTTSRREGTVEVRRTWQGGASAWTTVGVLREQRSDQVDPGNRPAGNAGVNLPISKAIAVSGEAELNRQSVVLATSEVRNAAVNASLSWAMPRGLQLLVHGRYSHDTGSISLYDAAALGPDSVAQFQEYLSQRLRSGYEVSMRLQKTFRWHNAALETGSAPGAANGVKRLADFGAVEGVVFNDLNRNGTRDPGEAGVSHVSLRLDDDRVTESDEAGAFAFKNVPVGLHAVALDERSVPAWWDMGDRRRMMVDVVKRGTASASFPLVQLGKLSGRVVVIDRTGSAASASVGHAPAGEPAGNVIVVLNDRYKITITDADGEFEFTALPAGEYRVSIDRGSLPQLWTPASSEVQTVVLTPGARVSGVEFAFTANARAVRRRVTEPQTLPDPRSEVAPPKRVAGSKRSTPPQLSPATRPPGSGSAAAPRAPRR